MFLGDQIKTWSLNKISMLGSLFWDKSQIFPVTWGEFHEFPNPNHRLSLGGRSVAVPRGSRRQVLGHSLRMAAQGFWPGACRWCDNKEVRPLGGSVLGGYYCNCLKQYILNDNICVNTCIYLHIYDIYIYMYTVHEQLYNIINTNMTLYIYIYTNKKYKYKQIYLYIYKEYDMFTASHIYNIFTIHIMCIFQIHLYTFFAEDEKQTKIHRFNTLHAAQAQHHIHHVHHLKYIAWHCICIALPCGTVKHSTHIHVHMFWMLGSQHIYTYKHFKNCKYS